MPRINTAGVCSFGEFKPVWDEITSIKRDILATGSRKYSDRFKYMVEKDYLTTLERLYDLLDKAFINDDFLIELIGFIPRALPMSFVNTHSNLCSQFARRYLGQPIYLWRLMDFIGNKMKHLHLTGLNNDLCMMFYLTGEAVIRCKFTPHKTSKSICNYKYGIKKGMRYEFLDNIIVGDGEFEFENLII